MNLTATILTISALFFLTLPVGGAYSHVVPSATHVLPPYATVGYTSSVDNFSLSYLEWLPTGYVSNQTYPLVIFLHGIGASTTWTPGGIGGDTNLLTAPGIVTEAQKAGVIIISLNTRSSAGFYVDTPCGGPQAQDVLDAITHEQSQRHIGDLYLVGFSMGSMGAFSLAANHPDMFRGIATAGTITDAYEVYSQNLASGQVNAAWKSDLCLPRSAALNNATLDGLFNYLSTPRLTPTAFIGVRLYVTTGAQDVRAVNDFSVSPYAQGNSTFVNSTCNVVTSEREPANCTTTFLSLSHLYPGNYQYRFIWEARGTHSPLELPAADMYQFLLGLESGGYFTANYPATVIHKTVP